MEIEVKDKEDQRNDLFFVCSLIEYIARATKNEKSFIVKTLGKDEITKLYNLADVYHCENIDKITAELKDKHHINNGNYDNLANITTNIPTHWDIGKVYSRIILQVMEDKKTDIISTLYAVYTSWLPRKIDNYQSSMYYENNSYLTASYYAGHPL